METELYNLHLMAGKKSGIERTCGKKVNYKSEETATKSAEKMNQKESTRRELEPYPCPFCEGWHIGGKMPIEILKEYIEN